MGRRTLYLIRHGQAAYAQTDPKDVDGYLTEVGQQQALLTAERLAELPITAIYHSDLERATQTAQLIASKIPDAVLQPTSLLRECIPCLPRRATAWMKQLSPEKIKQHQHWVETAFARYFTKAEEGDRHDILVCHGNILRYLICRALRVPPDAWSYADIHNCGISEVAVNQQGETILISHNDTGHLPYSMRTFL